MGFEKLTFGDFDPVTGAPNIDGLTAIPEAGLFTREASERGYVHGGRLTYGTGSGFPPVVIDAVRDGEFLALGFFCRFDLSFDLADTIVVALKPTRSSPQDQARRIDIHPVYNVVGTDEDGPGSSPGGAPDSVVPGIFPETHANPMYEIRTDHPPAELTHFRGEAAAGWTTQAAGQPPGTPYQPNGVKCRARSWRPPVATLTQTPAGVQNLPASGGTLNVLSVIGFPDVGQLQAGSATLYFTGRDQATNSFTGCSVPGAPAGGTVSIPGTSGVSIPEAGWSVELRIPTGRGEGEPQWIDLAPDFGLYIAVIRAGLTAASGADTIGGSAAVQHVFPSTAKYLTGTLDETLAIPAYGTGLIPSRGSSTALGVRIQNGELGIGARLGSTSTPPGNTIDRTKANEFVTIVENTDQANPGQGVTSEVRIANWGMPSPEFARWDRPPGATPNPSMKQTIVFGTPKALLTTWSNISIAYAANKHQCIWVQLSSTAAANFISSSERRNMDLIPLSSVERDAEISGVGYPAPPNGIHHEFLMITNTRAIRVPRAATNDTAASGEPGIVAEQESTWVRKAGSADTIVFLYIVHGYRITCDTLTIGDRTFEVVDPGPGSFGFISQHEGSNDVLTPVLTGKRLTGDGNVQKLKVPHNGTATVRARVEAGPAKATPRPDPSEHHLERWRRWLKWLLRLVRRIVRKLRGM